MNAYLKLFVDSLEKYQKLNDAEFGRLIRAALTYKASGEEVKLTGREDLLWDGMKLEIDRDNGTYETLCASRSEAGKKGAEARWQKDGKNSKCHLTDGKEWQKCQDKDKEEDKDKDKEKDKDSIPPKPPKKALIEEQFDQFWAAYPKKQSKADARKAFVKAMKLTTLDRMLQAIEEQKNSRQWNEDGGKYIPFPATWLNRANYENELTPDNTPHRTRPFVPTDF